MKIIQEQLAKVLQEIVFQLYGIALNPEEINVSTPKNYNQGGLTTNIAFVVAKKINRSATEVSKEISDVLNQIINYSK